MRDLPDHMLVGRVPDDSRLGEEACVNFLDWFLVVLVLAYAVSGYWQGFIAGAFATARPAARRAARHLAGAARCSVTPPRRCGSRWARCSSC